MKYFVSGLYLLLAALNLSVALVHFHKAEYGWMLFNGVIGIWMFMNSLAKAQQ